MLTSYSHLRLPHKKTCLKTWFPCLWIHVLDAGAEPDLPSHKAEMHLGVGGIGKGRPELLLLEIQVPEVGYLW